MRFAHRAAVVTASHVTACLTRTGSGLQEQQKRKLKETKREAKRAKRRKKSGGSRRPDSEGSLSPSPPPEEQLPKRQGAGPLPGNMEEVVGRDSEGRESPNEAGQDERRSLSEGAPLGTQKELDAFLNALLP